MSDTKLPDLQANPYDMPIGCKDNYRCLGEIRMMRDSGHSVRLQQLWENTWTEKQYWFNVPTVYY